MNRLCEVITKMCDDYCKYPLIYDEAEEVVPLEESEYCKQCPLNQYYKEHTEE